MYSKSKITIFTLFMTVFYSSTFAQMGTQNTITDIVRQFHVNFSNNEVEKNGLLVDDSLVVNVNGGAGNRTNGATFKGRDEFVKWLKTFKSTFPDSKIIDENIVVSGNKAAIRYIFTGIHSGTLPSANGPIQPTGRKVIMYAAEFFTFNDSGKLIYLETLTNDLDMITQLTSK